MFRRWECYPISAAMYDAFERFNHPSLCNMARCRTFPTPVGHIVVPNFCSNRVLHILCLEPGKAWEDEFVPTGHPQPKKKFAGGNPQPHCGL
uniref:Uncharacterized protein n=1 Tax=Romanomermis culicivorax TaxID=13658 RepID=A0A915IZF0_ROMCU